MIELLGKLIALYALVRSVKGERDRRRLRRIMAMKNTARALGYTGRAVRNMATNVGRAFYRRYRSKWWRRSRAEPGTSRHWPAPPPPPTPGLGLPETKRGLWLERNPQFQQGGRVPSDGTDAVPVFLAPGEPVLSRHQKARASLILAEGAWTVERSHETPSEAMDRLTQGGPGVMPLSQPPKIGPTDTFPGPDYDTWREQQKQQMELDAIVHDFSACTTDGTRVDPMRVRFSPEGTPTADDEPEDD